MSATNTSLTDPGAPLVVLLHGRGSNEADIIGLVDHLPAGPAYAAVRAPVAEGGGYAWFANRSIGRPIAESLRETMDWFRPCLDAAAPANRPVVLVGCSGGAAFAGGLMLDDPTRYAGAAVLFGTLPFDAGADTTAPLMPPRRQTGPSTLPEPSHAPYDRLGRRSCGPAARVPTVRTSPHHR